MSWIPLNLPISFELVEILKGIHCSERTLINNEWNVKKTKKNIDFLLNENVVCSNLLEAKRELQEETFERVNKTKALFRTNMKTQLYPFQEAGTCFLERRNGIGCIFDEPGTGKTIQTIAYISAHPEIRPILIVCPAIAKEVWKDQLWEHARLNGVVGKGKDLSWGFDKILIVNYEILKQNMAWFLDQRIEMIVCDEAHAIKNPSSQRSKAIKELMKGRKKKIFLTGTPILNRPIDLYPILKILEPNDWGTRNQFGIKYCDGKHNGFGWEFKGCSETEELRRKISPLFIRRTKQEVLPELPDKQISIVPIQINLKEYKKIEKTYLQEIKALHSYGNQIDAFLKAKERLDKLKTIGVNEKLPLVKQWVDNFLESDQKIVLFAVHHAVIDQLKLWYPNSITIDGRVAQEKRGTLISIFQNNPDVKVAICQIDAAGVATTMTASSTVAFVELAWGPSQHQQASDRVHRIGQKADSVNVYYLIAKETIEEKIAKLISEKQKQINSVLDNGQNEDSNFLSELLRKI